MNVEISQKIIKAREFFQIEKYPGNLFEHITKNDKYIYDYKLFLFKEDMKKISGFIGYSENGIPIICINYNRPIAHQNFTLAHEIGHYFLHEGLSVSDSNKEINSFRAIGIEKQANEFASELLYPKELFLEDYYEIINENLLDDKKRLELAIKVDELCHKYYLSFEMVLRKILFKSYRGSEYKQIRKEIDKITNGVSKCFDRNFYKVDLQCDFYKRHMIPYEMLERNVKELIEDGKISYATGEAILYRNGLLGNKYGVFER